MSGTVHPNSILLPITSDTKVGWKLLINGQPYDGPVESLVLENPGFGTLSYGQSPIGVHDQWSFRENGGGGAVIFPYVADVEGRVLVGVIQQNRPGQGGLAWNVPRGFIDPGETHFAAAQREFAEEFEASGRGKLFELPGAPGNPNSAFFDTGFQLEDGRPAGVRYYAVRFARADIEHREVNGDKGWRLRPDLFTSAGDKSKKLTELILGSKFIPWSEAAQLGDGFTLALSRLLAAHNAAPRP